MRQWGLNANVPPHRVKVGRTTTFLPFDGQTEYVETKYVLTGQTYARPSCQNPLAVSRQGITPTPRTEYIKTKHVLTVETYPRLRYQHPSTDSRRGIILTLNIVQNVLTGQTCSRPTYQHTLTASRRGTIPTVKTDYIKTTNVLTGQTYSRPHCTTNTNNEVH